MEEYEDINQKLEGISLLEQLSLIITFKANRDLLLNPISESLKVAIEAFKDEVFSCILDRLNFIELLLCNRRLKDFVMNRCDLRLDAYGRIKVYYNDEVIEILRFNYSQRELDKTELKKFFNNAIKTNRDVCIELRNPICDSTEFVITKCEDLKSKLKYYFDNFDDELCYKLDKRIKVCNVLLLNFEV